MGLVLYAPTIFLIVFCQHPRKGTIFLLHHKTSTADLMNFHIWQIDLQFRESKQKQMKSKQYPPEVYVLRKRVNPSSESSQLISDETVNQIRTGRQMLKKKA